MFAIRLAERVISVGHTLHGTLVGSKSRVPHIVAEDRSVVVLLVGFH